jgi:D-alanyl-D-alanine dipeptidase
LKYRNEPIIRQRVAWLKGEAGQLRLDGDDTGYRGVAISPLDVENPDPLVPIVDVATLPIYNVGKVNGLCEYYGRGLGGPATIFVRIPVLGALLEVDQLLIDHNRQLVVVDGWRPWWVQAALWRYLRGQIIRSRGLNPEDLTIAEELEVGLKADDVGSYCGLRQDDALIEAISRLVQSGQGEELAKAAVSLDITVYKATELFLTFKANMGEGSLKIEESAITAHGNGGAVDVWMRNTTTGKYVNLGVPFDYVPRPDVAVSPAVINYFDMDGINTAVYAEEVAQDPILRTYLRHLGITTVNDGVFTEAQEERRLLFHAMRSVGCSYFSLNTDLGEPWHFNVPNWYGGNQVAELPGSGNTCHALLADVRDRTTGQPMAVWSNEVAHRLAKEMGIK